MARGWTEYMLAENSGLAQSTISTWRRRNLQPNVASIEKICGGLGITLSQFFSNSEQDDLTEEQRNILELWGKLSPGQRSAVAEMIQSFVGE